MKTLPVLYIVVPCYNEEEALPLSAPVFRKKLGELIDAGEKSRARRGKDGRNEG